MKYLVLTEEEDGLYDNEQEAKDAVSNNEVWGKVSRYIEVEDDYEVNE